MIKEYINKVFNIDNLELLVKLPDNSIDLIYCDILYGTGRDFEDYKDLKANKDIIYNHYVPRIKEMYRILKDTGSIYLQMDTRINHWIRNIMDDIFGYDNFLNEIIWKKRNSGQNTKTNHFLKICDRIILYSKSKKYTFNIQYREISNNTIDRYNKIDEFGKRYLLTSLNKKHYTKYITLRFNNKDYDGNYVWTQETLDNRIKNGYIIEENTLGYLSYRSYLDIDKGSQMMDLWDDLVEGTSQHKMYNTQKPEKLIERIIQTSSNENDIVADFYMGSGTTCIVSKKLNRNYIGCDINPNTIDIFNERLNNINTNIVIDNNLFNF